MSESTPVMRVRLGFHLALASIFFPIRGLNIVVVALLAMMARKHAEDPEARPWVLRLWGLAVLDLLVVFAFARLPEILPGEEPIDPAAYFELEWDERDEPGLRIASVGEGSAAAEAGIEGGDVVAAIDSVLIDTVDDVQRVIDLDPTASQHAFDIERDGRSIRYRFTPDPKRRAGGDGAEREKHGFFEVIDPAQLAGDAESTPAGIDPDADSASTVEESPQVPPPTSETPAEPYDIGWSDVRASFLDQLPVLGLLVLLGVLGRRRGAPAGAIWWGLGGALFAGWCFAVLTEWSLIRHFEGLTPAATLLAISSQQAAQFVIGALVYLRMGHRLQMRGDGQPRAEVAPVIFLGVFYLMSFGFRVMVVTLLLQHSLEGSLPQEINPIETLFSLGLDSAGQNLLFLNTVILAPITEEILFRGLLFPALCLWIPPGWALVGSSALFALMHSYYGVGILLIFAYGMVFGWARWVSGGLRASILLHSGVNGLTMMAMTMSEGMF